MTSLMTCGILQFSTIKPIPAIPGDLTLGHFVPSRSIIAVNLKYR